MVLKEVLSILVTTVMPVSYTHLDVYKRQLLYGLSFLPKMNKS